MEQEQMRDEEPPDGEDIETGDMIRAYSGAPISGSMGSVSIYGKEGADVLGHDLLDEEDDDDTSTNEIPHLYEESATSGGRLLDDVSQPLDRSASASLAPPPHLTPNLGAGLDSPEPRKYSDRIVEDSEEEERVEDQEEPTAGEELDDDQDGEGEGEDMAGDHGDLGVIGPMAAASSSGGHRLNTLEGAPGRQLPMSLGGPSGQDDDDDDEEEDEDVQPPAPEGAYDPSEYDDLNVADEIRELFSYITRYTPQAIELEHRLRPYIPDYIPAVGDIDAFIKILPPDGSETKVGLTVLDEPNARQSDATVLDLQLRSLAKHTTARTVSVKTVESAEKNPKVIDKWVRDISDLHRAKPAPTVHYSKRMPDIDSLMQEWPGELEELLHELRLPNAALDLDLDNYAGLICAILDIPVYKSKIQSLHVLFTLYSEFRNSVHFRRLAEDNYMDNDDGPGDRLVID